ncbi:hypothetical protein HYC85_018219 [Camellia sinensis]|uniref:Uncharacterized protein n=1 Tax=Camellia sinensis TaxID=4442 RepID=A0A7J7GTQ0_CAMSI|nr:hypothetical protein HYC85_018219 [Camellia sinensis]
MYEGVVTTIKSLAGKTSEFPITMGLHQRSTLSPYLFALVINKLMRNIQDDVPCLSIKLYFLTVVQSIPEIRFQPILHCGGVLWRRLCANSHFSSIKGLIAGEKPIINLKGYIVGNGVADEIFDGNGLVPFAHGMALISDEMYEVGDAELNILIYSSNQLFCFSLSNSILLAIDGLNLYDILEPCYHRPTTTSEDANGNKNTTSSTIPLSFKQLGVTEKPLAVRKRIYGRAWPFRAPVKVGVIPMWPELMKSAGIDVPCTDDTVATAWLNNDAVRKAIHVNQVRPDLDVINMHAWDVLANCSGDHDMCVPYTGSQAWIRSLGYKITDEWRPWMTNDQVAGYTQGYDNGLTFLTIKGAGHTVPEYKPREALHFYSNWLEGKQI